MTKPCSHPMRSLWAIKGDRTICRECGAEVVLVIKDLEPGELPCRCGHSRAAHDTSACLVITCICSRFEVPG